MGHNASFSCNPVTGDIAYPAGCLVVIYNAKRNKQVRFLANKENKVISFLCYSSNGKYLAVGEVLYTTLFSCTSHCDDRVGTDPQWQYGTRPRGK